VDEVNLLDDHLVDVVLAAAAAGVNRIEREGISLSHPARFILVGTMNPEEGDLRPQLLDRFGLCVEVKAESGREMRVTTMEQREAFDAEPAAFIKRFADETRELTHRIEAAQRLLPRVLMSGRLRALISELCTEARVAGHRADLIIEQAARALAAFSARIEVEDEDIIRVAPLALRHRQCDQAPPPPPPEEKEHDHSHDDEPPEEDNKQEEEQNQDSPEEQQPPHDSKPDQDQSEADSDGGTPDESKEPNEPVNPDALEKVFEVGATFKVKPFTVNKDRVFRRGSGRRSRSRINGLQGRYVKSTLPRGAKDVALDATLRAAAPYQRQRQGQNNCAITIRTEDIREKVRERRIGNFLLFIVDASGSMGARGRMAATKGAIMSLLLDAYQKRDKVAMISFNKAEARLNLPPTSSIDMAARMLTEMPVGGRTPLNHALVKADEVLRGQLVRDPTARPIVVLITDGRSNVALAGGKPMDECLELARRLAREERIRFILVDTEEQGLIRFGLAGKIAEALKARYFQTADLKADTLLDLIKE
jgi:magnesium chelatase subunit D